MRYRIAALVAALGLVLAGLVTAQPGPAQASDSAYTHATYIFKAPPPGGYRPVNVKCHSTNSWRVMTVGQTTEQVCGGNGWIERTWGDADVYIHVRNDATGNVTVYPPGNNSIGGGSYNLWAPASAGAKALAAFKRGAKQYTYTP